jgi:SAM-dependent methyltransferase
MRYSEAVAAAPAGSAYFSTADLDRLSPAALRLALEPGAASPPLGEVALALGEDERLLLQVGHSLGGRRGRRLIELGRRPAAAGRRREAGRRLVRGLFWNLVYELEPDRWSALAEAEPVHPGILPALECDGARIVETAAGTGRLTLQLAGPARKLIAVEPSAVLRRRLAARLPAGPAVVAGVNARLPIADGWADLLVACAAVGPDPPIGGEAVLAEFARCVRPGGRLALVAPESPEWFEARGFQHQRFPTLEVDPAADAALAGFFGPLTPLTDLLVRSV